MAKPPCRFCTQPLETVFVDLGMSPLSNAFLEAAQLGAMEPFYPLRAYVCGECLLVQLEAFEKPESIFSDYAYFSSYSDTWLRHAETYAAEMRQRLKLGPGAQVVEVASNDGYLLQFFKRAGVPVLGIEPARNVAAAAQQAGIPTTCAFFGEQFARQLAAESRCADLLVGNNVLAHVPDLNDFVRGLKLALKPAGVITMEFPHLLQLILENQFDTIYHEHFSYFSFLTVTRVFAAHRLTVFDVDRLPTHGGSLRIYARHAEYHAHAITARVPALHRAEREAGLDQIGAYLDFGARVERCKRGLLRFLIDAKEKGKRVAAYGAPAKGNTLLNYCGIRTDLIDYAVDKSPHKHGRFLPGTHIPVHAPEMIARTRPDYLLVLPWNIKDEIKSQMSHVREWGCRFIVPIPEVSIE